VDQLGSDTCHHCKGDTWHVHMTDVASPYSPYDTWHIHMTYVEGTVVGIINDDMVGRCQIEH
jgi:hypothetical protein